ncbi:tetratricopeptide repeat protein [Hamadaea tsunoensis]|uniref:tetratricopeptide repeat protein n=1 Tax=Hamadaea tsunoensis TaxID=53368 RepID=UPI00042755CD|nr:tetratricopeptide repeat protein [Hamadaea tsunoensis]
MTGTPAGAAYASIPDPGAARTLDEAAEGLRALKVWAGDPSFEWITQRVNGAWAAGGRPAGELTKRATVVDCFKPGRRRVNADLLIAIVEALHPDVGYVNQWRQALRVIGGEARAAAQVRVAGTLPPDLNGFTGRATELDRLRRALDRARGDAGATVVAAIEGMAGVGKTQIAVHAGHLLARERSFERVLFVDLRGFDADPAQPPADPAAVLDGFLRLLGVPGQRIPHDLDARSEAFRNRLAGIRVLVVLDNATGVEQVRPLLAMAPGCLTLVTSRRRLDGLPARVRLALDVFTPAEAVEYLDRAVALVPVGADPAAARRIAHRCGFLPLALGLVAGHMRATPGWTRTDHADRLDERHRDRRLDTGIELALDLSYQHLPAEQRRLLRLLSLHPGHDFDAYAAAALTDADLSAAGAGLAGLRDDHLLQDATPGRHTFHDLIRAYAGTRAKDEERPTERQAALTRLFDYCLATAAAAMNTLYPARAHSRPKIPAAATPVPDLTDPDDARAWLDTERPTLAAVAAHAAAHGWPGHATRLSRTLFRYYFDGGHHNDAVAVHGHAFEAGRRTGDLPGQAHALADLGVAHLALGRHTAAGDHLRQALDLFRQAGDTAGQARALANLGFVGERTGRYQAAAGHFAQALTLDRQVGNRTGEARTLINLGVVEARQGRYETAGSRFAEALALSRQIADPAGEASALHNLGEVELRSGRYAPAGDHLRQALTLLRQVGDQTGEAYVLDSLGTLHTRLGRPADAVAYHQKVLQVFRTTGERYGEAWALNGLGEAARTAGRPGDALAHHAEAHLVAAEAGDRDQQARAHAGLGHAHRDLGDPALARHHYRLALALYTDLGTPEAEQIRPHLDALDRESPEPTDE